VWEIEVGRDPASLVPINTETVHFLENHVDVGTAPILESRVNAGIVHIHVDMLTENQIPRRSDDPTTLLWML